LKEISGVDRQNLSIDGALAQAREIYAQGNPESRTLHERALIPLPGGNTRTTLHFDPFPLVITRGAGARVWDADGHEYADFIGEYTAGLYGHSHPVIRAAINSVLDDGHVLCAPNVYEQELATMMCDRFPCVEQVRFTNSGTEANLMIVGAARHFTGRDSVLVFKGGYHGAVFLFAGEPSPINAPFPFVIGAFNDVDATRKLIEENHHRLAAILIEPVMGTSGALPATPEFLGMLREQATQHGIVLSFDEVMTSRLAPGGAQDLFNITPDMTAFGKYIGGGLTVGAFGGREDIMALFDPRRPDGLPHAGTFNNNVLTMAAGSAGLRDVYTAEVAVEHNARGDAFRDRLNTIARASGAPAQVTGLGSMLGFHFDREPINTPDDAARTSGQARALFHVDMLNRGFYTGKSGLSSLSLPLEAPDFDAFASAYEAFLGDYGAVL
jgi:glutamate-1-semialdehyde 2,1-aminomutase